MITIFNRSGSAFVYVNNDEQSFSIKLIFSANVIYPGFPWFVDTL